MNRRLAIVPLLALPLLVLLAISCGGQSQTSDQQPPQLSPEDQARQTVTDFLEMCKQGHMQEAVERYIQVPEDSQYPEFPWKEAMSKFLDNVLDYSIRDAASDNNPNPSASWVVLDLTVNCEGNPVQTSASFPCSPDGSQIITSPQRLVLDLPLEQALTNKGDDSLGLRIAAMVCCEREPGEVMVIMKNGVSEEEAYQIFASHGFDRNSVRAANLGQIYELLFSEDAKDIKSVIKELMLDENVKRVAPAVVAHTS